MGKYLWYAYCAFAPGAVSPLEGLLTHFEDEVVAHIHEKKCPFRLLIAMPKLIIDNREVVVAPGPRSSRRRRSWGS